MSGGEDLLGQINNAVLDLQGSDLQSYPRPLKKLGRLLAHADLADINEGLVAGLDLDGFITEGQATQGGMVGTATLDWPADDRETLGLQLLLIRKFSDDPDSIIDFGHTFYYGGSSLMNNVSGVISHVIIPFARDYKAMFSVAARPRLG